MGDAIWPTSVFVTRECSSQAELGVQQKLPDRRESAGTEIGPLTCAALAQKCGKLK